MKKRMTFKTMRRVSILAVSAICCMLICTGCGQNRKSENVDNYMPQGSFEEESVAYPRISYTVPGYGLYYIPISADLVNTCRDTIMTGIKTDVSPKDYLGLFSVEISPTNHFTVYSSTTGGYYSSDVCLDEIMSPFLAVIELETGCDPQLSLMDFSDIEQVEIYSGDIAVFTSQSKEKIEQLIQLLSAYQGSSASRFEDYVLELRCTKANGKAVSLCLAVDEGYLYIPPFRYYKLPQESPLRNTAWLELMGLSDWPDAIMPYRYQYPKGFFDGMDERTGLYSPNYSLD